MSEPVEAAPMDPAVLLAITPPGIPEQDWRQLVLGATFARVVAEVDGRDWSNADADLDYAGELQEGLRRYGYVIVRGGRGMSEPVEAVEPRPLREVLMGLAWTLWQSSQTDADRLAAADRWRDDAETALAGDEGRRRLHVTLGGEAVEPRTEAVELLAEAFHSWTSERSRLIPSERSSLGCDHVSDAVDLLAASPRLAAALSRPAAEGPLGALDEPTCTDCGRLVLVVHAGDPDGVLDHNARLDLAAQQPKEPI
jgi:hypothetical protein